jgi:hypothetical protein
MNSCVYACGGRDAIRSDGNSCDSVCVLSCFTSRAWLECALMISLSYLCHCNSGVRPDLRPFVQTVPALKCQFWSSQCQAATVVESEQVACSAARNATCGTRLDTSAALRTSSSSDVGTSSLRSLTLGTQASMTSIITITSSSASPSSISVPRGSAVLIGMIVGAVVGSIEGFAVLCVLVYLNKHQQDRNKRVASLTPYK